MMLIVACWLHLYHGQYWSVDKGTCVSSTTMGREGLIYNNSHMLNIVLFL